MSLYRVLAALEKNQQRIPAGDFIASGDYAPAVLDRLEAVGAIAPLHAPPLAEIPDLENLAALAAIGIVQADQLLEGNIQTMSEQSGLGINDLRALRAEVSNWLILPVRAGG